MANKPELKRAVAGSKIKANDYNYNFEQLNNYIENGIADNAISNYEPDREYKKGQWVLAEVEGKFGLYESLVDGNKGSSLTDENYWKKVIDDEVGRIVGKIEEIEEEIAEIPTLIPDNSALIASYLVPDITTEVIRSNTGFTSEKVQWLYVLGSARGYDLVVLVNGVEVHKTQIGGTTAYPILTTSWFLLGKDDVVTVNVGAGATATLKTFNCKGVN